MTEPEGTTPDVQPPAPQTEPPRPDDKGPVPYHRFVDVIRERDDFRAKWEAASAADTALTEARTEAQRVRAELDAERAARAEDRAFYGAGLADPDAQDVARLLYGKVAEKPEGGLSAWLAATTADPENAPLPLRPYLTAPKPSAKPAPPDPTNPAGPQRVVNADTLEGMIRDARERKDWKAFDDLVKQDRALRSRGR